MGQREEKRDLLVEMDKKWLLPQIKTCKSKKNMEKKIKVPFFNFLLHFFIPMIIFFANLIISLYANLRRLELIVSVGSFLSVFHLLVYSVCDRPKLRPNDFQNKVLRKKF